MRRTIKARTIGGVFADMARVAGIGACNLYEGPAGSSPGSGDALTAHAAHAASPVLGIRSPVHRTGLPRRLGQR